MKGKTDIIILHTLSLKTASVPDERAALGKILELISTWQDEMTSKYGALGYEILSTSLAQLHLNLTCTITFRIGEPG